MKPTIKKLNEKMDVLEQRVKDREQECSGQSMTNEEILAKLRSTIETLEEVRNSLNPGNHEEMWIPPFNSSVRNILQGATNCISAAIYAVLKTVEENSGG